MNTVIDLEQVIANRNKAEAECWEAIREDAKIADNQRDYWKCQNSGMEVN